MTDMISTKYVTPEIDKLQNVDLIMAREDIVNKESIIIFRRKIVSCDNDEDLPILSGVPLILYLSFFRFFFLFFEFPSFFVFSSLLSFFLSFFNFYL